MLGPFLEIGIATRNIAEALAFYEALGFVQAPVGDAWAYPYAVVTDGHISLGLHGTEFDGPLLTFVAPDVRARLADLDALGIEVEHARLDDLSMNEVRFRDPAGQQVRLLEARTFSPPSLAPDYESQLGYFEECGFAVDTPAALGRFWEALGFVAFASTGEVDDADDVVVASRRDLNLGFRAATGGAAWLCFSSTDAEQRVQALRARGYVFARRLPAALQSRGGALLQAPDDVQLLLRNL